MPKLETTVGQLLVNSILPEDMRNYQRQLDKKGVASLLREVAERYPDRYREISFKLGQIGHRSAYLTGGNSFRLSDMLKANSAKRLHQQLRNQLQSVLDDDKISDKEREDQIIRHTGAISDQQQKEILDESLAANNQLAMQLKGAGRGSPMNLASLRGGDLLYVDHHGHVIGVPVLNSYAEGLRPSEYWAGTYGARAGTIAVKFATQDAGFLSKQLNQIVHRFVVSQLDADKEPDTLRGLPVDTSDDDNEGALLAHPAGGYPRNTVLTPKVLKHLRQLEIPKILVRSPVVMGSPDGGLYARDVGVREHGGLPGLGEHPAMAAVQSLSEPLSQAQLSAKHGGGVAGSSAQKAVGGFEYINNLIQVPKAFKGAASHSEVDGLVQHVEAAPAGGHYVTIGGQQHYVAQGYDLRVKPGQEVEAGDVISDGIPNPSIIVHHKGVGEGRRYFVNAFRQALKDAGIKGHRRNIELLSRGLINHVRLSDEVAGGVPGDVIQYNALEHSYEPREKSQKLAPRSAMGKYLERPYLHYTIGTKVRPSMVPHLGQFGIHEIEVHDDPPPFEPEMVRGMDNLKHDPDWMPRMLGSSLKSSLLDSVRRGSSTDEAGTSYVPGLAKAVDFGHIGVLRTPTPPFSVPK